jgi:hypothetical protein
MLARAFGNSAEFLLNVQRRMDLWEALHSTAAPAAHKTRQAGAARRLITAVLRSQFAHDLIKLRLAFEADAGTVTEADVAVLHPRIVGKAAECAEYARVRFGAAKAKAGRNRERHLIAAMRK